MGKGGHTELLRGSKEHSSCHANTGQHGFPLPGKKEVCFPVSLITQCSESGWGEERTGAPRRRKQGLRGEGSGDFTARNCK